MQFRDEKYIPESRGKKRLDDQKPPRPADIDRIPEDSHPSRFSKLTNILAALALLLAAFAVGLYLYWSFADENVLQVNNSPFPVRTIRQHPTAAGVVILTVDLCKRADLKGTTRTSFVSDSREVFLPMSEEKLPKGCIKNQEVPVLIPKDIAPGTYKIKFRTTYDINPIKRNIANEFETRTFVVDPTPQAQP